MPGRVVQLSVSPGGLPKRPVAGSFLTSIGFRGDPPHPAELALLIACADDAASFGSYGENVTASGLDCRRFRPGQRYRIGEAVIELTRPCEAGSYYASVVMTGWVRVNDNIELIDAAA